MKPGEMNITTEDTEEMDKISLSLLIINIFSVV